jgi:uncharacterized membrane protein
MNSQSRYGPVPRTGAIPSAQHVRRGNGIQEHTYPPNYRREPTGIDGSARLVLGASGAALVWYGLRQESALRWPLALFGAGLLYQGVSGNNMFDQMPMIERVPVAKHLTSVPAQLRIRKTLTVNRPAEDLYTYWHRLENLPTFMHHVKSVQNLGEGRSHWVVNVLRDTELEWDAQITVDRPNEMIAWETLPEARVQNRGYVKFIPTPHGTEVSVSIEYDPPGSVIGRLAGGAVKFIAAEQVKEDILNLKRLMETGRIPTTEGQPAARPEAWHQHELRYGRERYYGS